MEQFKLDKRNAKLAGWFLVLYFLLDYIAPYDNEL